MNNEKELIEYNDWILSNKELIIENYSNSLTDDEIYELIPVDDLPKTDDADEWDDAVIRWAENLDIDDVPDEYMTFMYESYIEENES